MCKSQKYACVCNKGHMSLSGVCVLSMWISCATDVVLFVKSMQQNPCFHWEQSLVVSSAMNKWGCFKIRTFTWDDWQCQHLCFLCTSYSCKLQSSSSINTCETAQLLIIVSFPVSAMLLSVYGIFMSQFFSCSSHSPIVCQWPQGPLLKCTYGYIWLEVLITFLFLLPKVVMAIDQ